MRIVSGFDNTFLAAQLHFHWGTKEDPGSEHTIDSVHFPAEIHVVHYNSKYPNISEAASKLDGLAVLGAFIGIGLHENENYEKILSSLRDVSREESDTEIPGLTSGICCRTAWIGSTGTTAPSPHPPASRR
uniref:Carbonic anhydrase n=1 Tax=Anguilla anguilla TaxID=7936 RepID=A0A0E9X640_ANGAN